MNIPTSVEVLGRTLYLIANQPLLEGVPIRDQTPYPNHLTYVSRPEAGEVFDCRADLVLEHEDSSQAPMWTIELRYQSALVKSRHPELNQAALGLLARLDEDLSRLFRLRGLLRRTTRELVHASRAAAVLSHGPISFVD